jgi:hypothetical protein
MITRRGFSAFCAGAALSGCKTERGEDNRAAAEVDSPPAIVSEYFPDRVHEFVFRNWTAVQPARLAEVLGCAAQDVLSLAESMGLSPAVAVPPEMTERAYTTIIKRNWHLLPLKQLEQLVGMSPERMQFVLREDDMLWYKLGLLKPHCEPIVYRAPDDSARRRAADIRALVRNEFGSGVDSSIAPRFEFIQELSTTTAAPANNQNQPPPIRVVYPYFAVYGDPLLSSTLDPCPSGLLQRLSAEGINGIWLHGVLRDLAPGGKTFPEFGKNSETRLNNLRSLVKRAAQYGIGVYLYFNEPRAMPEAFFKTRPELAGVHENGFVTLCTSQPAVREWMADALTHVFSKVPALAGVFTISASENLTNCASHFRESQCPRCKLRSDADIYVEVNATIEAGIHRANPQARVLVSDWGWRKHGDAVDIIARLPKSIWLMTVSEWSKPFERGGIKTTVGEYSVSVVGPGPRALRHWEAARKAGFKIVSDVQLNNSCELATLPYLPVMNLIAEHLHNLAPIKLDGFMIGWTQGGYPSPTFDLARKMARSAGADMAAALDELAKERYGPAAAPHARKAWTQMSEAFREYPFATPVIYTSPVQLGPANPIYAASTGYRATMWGFPYDDLDRWRGPYPREIFAEQFEKMATGWRKGVEELTIAVKKVPPERRLSVERELRMARSAGIIFQSVANQSYFVLARDALAKDPASVPEEKREHLRSEMKRRLESEITLARELFSMARQDSSIGFEPATQYFYLPLDLVEKVINCRWLLTRLDSKEPQKQT